MVSRCKYQNSSELGAYAKITNAYALVPFNTSENFFSVFEEKLAEHIPVFHASIAGTPIIGRLCVGNAKGLLLPSTTTDRELQQIRDCLPDAVVVQRVEERLSALGNAISCNDHVALYHPELDPLTVEIMCDVLGVDAMPSLIADEPLVGTYSIFSNRGGVVSPKVTVEQLQELAGQVGVELTAATVNRGQSLLGAGICVNDWTLFCGWETTALEIANLTRIFKIDDSRGHAGDVVNIDESLIDMIL
jgi:translation initiation factor 6